MKKLNALKKRLPYFLVLLVSVISPYTTCNAQYNSLNFQHISIGENLSQSTVNAIQKDFMGFLWFGTEDGLNLYDGNKIMNYKFESNNKNSISHSAIWSIYEDADSNLWIGTFDGLNRYDRELDIFIRYMHDPSDPASISNGYIKSIIQDSKGYLWFGTNNGLCRMNPDEKTFTTYYFNKSTEYDPGVNVINSMQVDHLGKLWIATNNGLRVYNDKNETFSVFYLPEKYRDSRFLSVFEDVRGELWVGSESFGLFNFDRISSTFIPANPLSQPDLADLKVTAINATEKGLLWIGTDKGLIHYDPETGETSIHTHNPYNKHSIADSEIKCIYSETNGFLWIGTVNGGVNIINPALNRFKHIVTAQNNPRLFNSNVVISLYENNNGQILFGATNSGLTVYDREKDRLMPMGGRIGSLVKDMSISTIFVDGDINWLGTSELGLIKYNSRTQEIRIYKDELTAARDGRIEIKAIAKSSDGYLWIGTDGHGLIRHNPRNNTFTRFIHHPDNPASIRNNRVFSIVEDRKNNLWIATAGGGLNKYLKDSEEFISYSKSPSDSSNFTFQYILSILEDKTGNIWAGTFGNGLIRYNPEKEKFSWFSEENGLPNNVIYSIIEDNSGKLWLSHNRGITKFDTDNLVFRNYDVEDGLQGNEFNANVCYKTTDGHLLFGGINGLNIFHPDSIKPNLEKPRVVFTGLKISNKNIPVGETAEGRIILNKSISLAEEVQLKYSDREVQFEFSALDYSVPSKNQYRYKLEGRDNDWIELGNLNHISFHNLPQRRSVLHVCASNSDGIWNEVGTRLVIYVKPPFYNTLAFYILMLFFFISLVVYVYYRKTENLSTQNKELEKLVESKTREIAHQRDVLEMKNEELEQMNQVEREQRNKTAEMAERLEQANQSKLQFFTNISHEFRTPLSLIIGSIEKLKDEKESKAQSDRLEDYQMIEKNANTLLKLLNRLMHFRKLSTQEISLKISEHNLVEFIRNHVSLYKNLAEKKDIEFSFESSLDSMNIWFDSEQMEEVIANLLSNAFKFSPEHSTIRVITGLGTDPELSGLSDIKPENPEDYVYFAVMDTGIGIPRDKQSLVFKRFYQVTSEHNSGTGIGLHICEMIIQHHKGMIGVKSEENEGAAFIVFLKTGKDHLSEHEFIDAEGHKMKEIIPDIDTADTTVKTDNSANGQTIDRTIEKISKSDLPKLLIVEDNKDLRKFMVKGLRDEYSISEADSGKQVMKLMEETDPEIIICDVLLPGKINGFDIVENIKSNINTSHIPIILLTALDSVDQKVLGLEKGADLYLTKPFSLRELKAHLQSILQSRIMLKKKFREHAFLKARDYELSTKDESFIQKTIRVIETGMSDPNFNVTVLCDAMNMSQTKLYRKVKALTDLTISDFIRGLRLRKASALLIESDKNVSEIAYEVGFNDPNYFGKCFKAQFGCSPSEFVKEQKTKS